MKKRFSPVLGLQGELFRAQDADTWRRWNRRHHCLPPRWDKWNRHRLVPEKCTKTRISHPQRRWRFQSHI